MKYTKNFRLGIGFGKVGRNAHKVSKVWKLGIHAFMNDTNFIFRICYLRTIKATHYWQFFIQIKENNCCCGQEGEQEYNGGSCEECMKDAPYEYCCKIECGEHEFCRGCQKAGY